MSDEPNIPPPIAPLTRVENKKKIWPWLLLQFVPALATSVFVLLQLAPRTRAATSKWSPILCGLVFFYCYVLSFFFFRSRDKSISYSLLVSIATTLVVIMANVILILGIVFVGCLVILGTHAK